VYRTVRNADLDANAGSVVRCCEVPYLYYGTGARADARIWTSFLDLRLSPRTAYRVFLKLNHRKHERIHQRLGADPNFF
jgi:hypothetical protein